jgi:predicted lipoprotein with Yx(FWY)xxD motif
MSQIAARIGRPIAITAVALALAACTSEADATPEATEPEPTASPTVSATESATEEPTASAEPTDSPDDSADASVVVADSDHGQILTDADGNTIYFFANDTEGVSNCSGECLANWPAVEADDEPVAGDGVDAELGTIERDDGTVQLTVNGFPAYYFAGDEEPGDTNGQGVGEFWWVFGADGEPIEG